MSELKIDLVQIKDLKRHPGNPRKNDKAAEKLAKAILQNGLRCPIYVNRDNFILKGNTTHKALEIAGYRLDSKIPVIYLDFETEQDELALEWLTTAVDRGFVNYPLLTQFDPFLKRLHSGPRFQTLMERVKSEWETFATDADPPLPRPRPRR